MQSKEKKKPIQGLPVMNQYAAGADIGDTRHDIAINDGKGGHIVRTFGTFTSDIQDAVNWLKEEGITTIAMESTGVYYLTFYLMCEEAGIEPYLVNARHVKNVTGRKKDETDAMWIQRLHTCGMLKSCFQPENDFRTLRKSLITRSSDEVRRMQKSLEQMNIKIHVVISDILGKTGMQIIEAIIAGNHDPEDLSTFRDPRIKASREDIIKSLQGIWKDEYLFTLTQAYDKYGCRGASLATAHKVAKIIYAMLDKKQEFNFDLLIDSQSRYREQKIRQLERQIERLKKAA